MEQAYPKTHAKSQLLAVACLSLATLGMAAQLFFKIHRFAVNILFSDQWDTYAPLFYNYGIWKSFTQPVGPVRLGAGVLVTEAVATATRWNTRTEAFVVGFIMVLIVFAAIYLKWRLFRKLTLWDSLIPLIFLSPPQIDAASVVTFPAYSAVPILLLMLYMLCLTSQNLKVRYGVSSFLNFLLVFSVWGIFVGFLTPLLLGYLLFHETAARYSHAKRWAGIALAVSLLSLGLFFVDYKFQPAVDCIDVSRYPLRDYLWFMGQMFSYSVGVTCGLGERLTRGFLSPVFGFTLLSTFVGALILGIWKLTRNRDNQAQNLVTVFLISFSLIFAACTAAGRLCLGDCVADAGRYQALLVPAWLGLYFTVTMLTKRRIRVVAALLLFILCFLFPQLHSTLRGTGAGYYTEAKQKWRDCYLEKEDAPICDQEAGLSIYAPVPSYKAKDRLNYLKQQHLNFYADR